MPLHVFLDIDAEFLGGFTPLLYAAREGCIECAKELVAGGADLDLPDPHRVTPLNLALLNLHFDFAAYLIEAGADVNKWDLYGRSPLYLAADTSTLPVSLPLDGRRVWLVIADSWYPINSFLSRAPLRIERRLLTRDVLVAELTDELEN